MIQKAWKKNIAILLVVWLLLKLLDLFLILCILCVVAIC